jgi:hypothetical protein
MSGWSIQPSPNPNGSAGSFLLAVSCADDGTCTAVGYDSTGSVALAPAEHWDGSAWSIESTPNPRGARGAELTGVSCGDPTSCVAVGYWISSKGKVLPLGFLRSGSTWRRVNPPKPLVAS